MKTAIALALLVVTMGTPLPAQECSTELPASITVAVPGDTNLRDARTKGALQGFFSRVYARHGGPCAVEERLQVNLSAANEYQILDWLGQGLVDGAIVGELAIHLLEQDGVDVVELPLTAVEDELIRSEAVPLVLGRRRAGTRWEPVADAMAEYQAFIDQAWCRAVAPLADALSADGRTFCDEPRQEGEQTVRFATHLSTSGFVRPLEIAAARYNERFASHLASIIPVDTSWELEDRFWREIFERAEFAIDCSTIAECWGEDSPAADGVQLLFPSEAAIRSGVEGGAEMAPPVRARFVLRAEAAERLFGDGRIEQARADLSRPLHDVLAETPPLSAFRPLLAVNRYLGVRTYGFTLPESIRLLRDHQKTSGSADLALVLPGGGVKAAYQTRLIDELYGKRYLANDLTGGASGQALPVRWVIGTSGGALLGYFVAQLRENGPFTLTNILWQRGDAPLRSTDIFGWTDLLRWFSIIAAFLIFAVILAVASMSERGWFRPRGRAQSPAWRVRLTLVIAPVLFLTPILLRIVDGARTWQHIPEIEGVMYAIIVLVAMFADQCLILDKKKEPRSETGELERFVRPGLALGLVMVFAPLAGSLPGNIQGAFRAAAPFSLAYLVLASLVVGFGMILPLRFQRRLWSERGRRVPAALGELAVALGIGLLPALAPSVMSRMKLPYFLIFLALMVLIAAANARLPHKPLRWSYWLFLIAGALLVGNLCWPDGAAGAAGSAWSFLTLPSFDITVGAFVLSIGAILTLISGIAWVYVSDRRYHVRDSREFLTGLVVALEHAFAAYLLMFAVFLLAPDWLSPLELTGRFWTGLAMASVAIGVGLLAWGRYSPKSSFGAQVSRGLGHLCGHHPNGEFVTRRFARVAILSVLALGWWNMILAPALYGNKKALNYLNEAIARFEEARGERGYQPTARFITPANLLEVDGTRYFLVIPPDADCPAIARRPGSGATWEVFRASAAGGPTPASDASSRRCRGVRRGEESFLRTVIFASGSPFPIFPATLVDLPDRGPSALVDGGYSNDVPVEAALTVSAQQVLIVDSSSVGGSPAPVAEASVGQWGRLIENLQRLPGFLFERSQQVDRQSRRDLFVLSFSPSPEEKGWPALFDFRPQVVERMKSVATRDLTRRLGLVESWGRPRIQSAVSIDPVAVRSSAVLTEPVEQVADGLITP